MTAYAYQEALCSDELPSAWFGYDLALLEQLTRLQGLLTVLDRANVGVYAGLGSDPGLSAALLAAIGDDEAMPLVNPYPTNP